MYFPLNWEFGRALSKIRNFEGRLNPPETPLSYWMNLGKTEDTDIWKKKHWIPLSGVLALEKATGVSPARLRWYSHVQVL
jgi:hypothetical protein